MGGEALVGMIGLCVGAVVWLVRLEGRVNSHEQKCDERQKRMDERHEQMTDMLQEIRADVKALTGRP